MGYNHAAAFLPVLPRPKFFPPFGGPVLNWPEILKGTPNKYPTKAEVDSWGKNFEAAGEPLVIPPVDTNLLNLRAKWLELFLGTLALLNPAVPRAVATLWVDFYLPRTAEALTSSFTSGYPESLAQRLADAWEKA